MNDKTQLVTKLSEMAKLPLASEQLSSYTDQFESIMEYMDKIKTLPLSAVEETSRVTDEENVMREDLVTQSFTQKEALANAYSQHDGFFMVEAILDKEE